MVAFFSKNSPLSNYYKCEEIVDQQKISCQEQHYTYHKSMTFNDRQTANRIMKEHRPSEMKKLGKHISGYVHKVWKSKKVEVMRHGLHAKFKNSDLKHFLLGTGKTILMEASPNDKFWGTGMSMYNPRIWATNNWIGNAENTMGKLLHEIRTELKREMANSD